MRYFSEYVEYPIYEPAEDGVYYTGNALSKSTRMSKRSCRKTFEKRWQECVKENKKNGFTEDADWDQIIREKGVYPWVRTTDNYVYRDGYYIGSGESFAIERHSGQHKSGWQPYC